MTLVAINGTNFWPLKYGRLEHFFAEDADVIFPYKPAWLPWNVGDLLESIDDHIAEDEPYDVIGFSSGATIAHLLAAKDKRVRLLVASSGLGSRLDFEIRPDLKVLLTSNEHEKDSMRLAMCQLFMRYREAGADVSMETIYHSQHPAHRFGPAIPSIQRWVVYRTGEGFPFLDSLVTRCHLEKERAKCQSK